MPITINEKSPNHFSYQELDEGVQKKLFNELLNSFYNYFNCVTEISDKEEFFDRYVKIDEIAIIDLLVRVDKRKDYYVIYHDYEYISELKEASLLAYWILKYKPFSLDLPQNKRKKFNVRDFNLGFALYLILCAIKCSVWQEKKSPFSLEISTIELMSYAFKNWDLSKESIILLTEVLADSKIKEKKYDSIIPGLQSFAKN